MPALIHDTWLRYAPSNITRVAQGLGSSSVGVIRSTRTTVDGGTKVSINTLQTTYLPKSVEDNFSAEVLFYGVGGATKYAQYAVWLGDSVLLQPSLGEQARSDGTIYYCAGGGLIKLDGLATETDGSDALAAPINGTGNNYCGTLTFTASTDTAAGTNPTIPPGPMTKYYTQYAVEGTPGVHSPGAGGVAHLILPHLMRCTSMIIDMWCLDNTSSSTNAATSINAAVRFNRR